MLKDYLSLTKCDSSHFLKFFAGNINRIKGLQLLFLLLLIVSSSLNSYGQCANYQVYESIGTVLPTSGGTWTATSMGYDNGGGRTGSNRLLFNALGDIIRTPQIANPGVFSFWYARSSNSANTPQFTVETSPDNSTWTSRGTTGTFSETYTQFSVNLGALSLTNVYVRIRDTRASGTAARYVDDISWTSTVALNNIVIPSLANCSQTITCGTSYSFSDSGANNDTYNASEDYTITFTPSIGTNKIQLNFSAFSTEAYDGMIIYNGPTTASPIISSGLGVGSGTLTPAGSFYGTTSPGIVTSTDASGAITIRFRSDSSTNLAGWTASVTCVTVSVCTTPTAQPTLLTLTPTVNSIGGSFTAASPAPSKYLVVRSTSATPPSPVNGTNYAVASTALGAGTYVVANGTATTFSDATLPANTQYYYYIFSYNDSCTGAPYYLTTSPLTANTYTCLTAPTSSAGTSVTSGGFTANWATVSGATGYLLDVSTVNTFASFVAGYNGLVVSGGSTVSQAVTGLSANTTYYYRVRATNATSCTSASSATQTVYTGHCIPTPTTGTATYINNFSTTGGTANVTNNASGFTAGAYQNNYASMTVSQYATNSITYSFTLAGGTAGVAIWVDWNDNLVFETSERVYNSAATIANGTYTGSITVPSGQALGNYRMRIKTDYLSGSPDPCTTSSTRTESEDYKFTVIAVPTDAVDYANIQSPGVSTTTTGTPVDIYGQAYEPGVTDPAGAATGLLVWYSTNATDVDPSSAGWTGTWTAATFNTNVGNNDEWKGTINPIIGQADTYYSFRYQLNGGPYRYGGYPSGFWNGTSQKNGKLSVNYEVYTNSTPKTINDVITINFKDFDASNIFYTGTETTIYAYAGIRIVSGTDFNYAQGNINTISSLIPFTLSGGIYSSTIKLADYFCIPAGVNVDGVNMIFRNQYFTGGNCDGTFGNNDKTCNLYLDLTNATVAVNPPTAVANNTVTLTSANVTFTAPLKGTNKGYEYYVSTSATTPGAGVTPVVAATSSPVAISGLSNATTYYIYVRTVGCGSDRSAWSAYTSFTTLSPPPANDACANATSLPCGTVNLTGTTVGSVSEVLSVTAWNASTYGVWYTFVGDGTLNLISTTAGSGFDHKLSIASGTCGTLTNVTTVDDGIGGETETFSFTPVLGTVYYVYISYYGSSGTVANTGTFTISRTCNVIPTYCTAHTDHAPEAYIDDVQFIGTLNDVSNLNSSYSNSPSGYQDFTALPKSIQAQGEGVNVYVNGNTHTRIYAWVDWNNDGDFSDSGEQIYDSAAGTSDTTFGFIIPAATPPGNYRIRIRNGVNYYDDNGNGIIDLDDEIFYPSFDSCVDFEETTYFGDDDLYYGEAEDYLFTVIANCFATIDAVNDGTRCGPGNVSLTATGSTGTTTYLWYAAQTGGAPLQNSASNTYSPTISATTTFYVTASNGTCESLVRKPVVANMKEVPDVNFSPATPITCGDKNPIMLSAASDNETVYLVNENFEGSGLGLFGNQNIVGNGGTINQISRWERKSSPFIPTDGADVWTPSISSGYGVNKFAFSTSDVGPKTVGPPATYYVIDHGLALTSAVNTQNYTDLTLKFRVYFSRYNINTVAPASEYLAVETSTNGTTWTPVANANYSTDLGTPGNFQQITVNMNSFINIATLQFRIRYYASSWYDGVAVDDIQLYGTKPLVASFTWSGSTDISVYTDALGTIPYVPGSAEDIVYIQPNIALLATPSFNIDVTTQLTNGCTITKTINVTNKSKVWNGSANTAWENANNWSPVGVPSTDDCIIIPSTTVKPVISDVAQGKNLAIKSLGELLVNSDKVLTVQDAVDVNAGGKITFENNASLVQVNENPSINSGNIIYKRNSGNMLRYSYTYWASPVFATAQTLSALSPATLHDKYYSWDSAGQSWTLHNNGTVTMEKAKGYIVRAPQTYPITGTAASYNATFNGVPNNGLITIATQGSTTAEKFNLIGNPYPSALDANLFLASSINPDLEGTIYLWTNFTGVSSVPNAGGNYSYTDSDYATYNFSGGTATAPATGSSVEPTGYVAAGQSFFVKGISNGSGTATFNNTMRIGANNNQFFRNSQIERHRFWLNLENSQGGFNQALIAYVQGATNDYDRGYDGELFGGNTATFYSIIPDKTLTIQGKSLPFDLNDVVPMGYKTTVAGNYKITLDHFDGLFDTQAVYLKDKLLNTIHDIKNAPYSFTSAVGTFDNRFEIVYRQETLGVNNPKFDPNSIVIYKKEKEIFINAGLASISQLRVFDIQGRMIYENKNINKTDAVIKNLPPAEQVLIVQVVLLDGNTVSKKVVY